MKRLAEAAKEETALREVDKLNEEWRKQGLQVTVFKDDKVLRHTDVATGADANLCFKDAIMGLQTRYPLMKSYGEGVWVGSLEGYPGRISAVAYGSLHERRWLVAVEAHVSQGRL